MNDMDKMLNMAAQKLGTDKENIQKAMKSGSADSLLSSLGPQEAQKLKKILSDKSAIQKIMQSEQAKNLMKKFSEGK